MSANETQNKEFQQEEKQLFNCLDIIRDNIKRNNSNNDKKGSKRDEWQRTRDSGD